MTGDEETVTSSLLPSTQEDHMPDGDAPLRIARITRGFDASDETIKRYLPDNYTVVGTYDDCVLIAGHDHLGWTLDGYVLPRLASGLHFGTEITTKENHHR